VQVTVPASLAQPHSSLQSVLPDCSAGGACGVECVYKSIAACKYTFALMARSDRQPHRCTLSVEDVKDGTSSEQDTESDERRYELAGSEHLTVQSTSMTNESQHSCTVQRFVRHMQGLVFHLSFSFSSKPSFGGSWLWYAHIVTQWTWSSTEYVQCCDHQVLLLFENATNQHAYT
jgi:hypothetical protein